MWRVGCPRIDDRASGLGPRWYGDRRKPTSSFSFVVPRLRSTCHARKPFSKTYALGQDPAGMQWTLANDEFSKLRTTASSMRRDGVQCVCVHACSGIGSSHYLGSIDIALLNDFGCRYWELPSPGSLCTGTGHGSDPRILPMQCSVNVAISTKINIGTIGSIRQASTSSNYSPFGMI